MMIEQNTNYAYKLKYMDNPTFDKVRDLAVKFYCDLPQELRDELYEALNRGIDILDSEPQMTAYMFSFGKMHQAKLEYAFGKLPEEFFGQPEINIIDYGCGQALGTMCYADFLRKKSCSQKVKTITLIEPSEICLKRAALHASVFLPDAEIKTVNKKFDDLTKDDIICSEYTPTLHILSNVLDMSCLDLDKFSSLVKDCLKGYNQFVCVGPFFNDFIKDGRIKKFAAFFNKDSEYETLDQGELNPQKDWTCALCLFANEKYNIFSTKVTEDDLADAYEDDFGAMYSRDGKRLLRCDFGSMPADSQIEYTIKDGTSIICDYAFSSSSFSSQNINIIIPQSVVKVGIGIVSKLCLENIDIISYSRNIKIVNITNKMLIDTDEKKLLFCFKEECNGNVVIPPNVTTIGEKAFEACWYSIRSISIHSAVTRIESNAFYKCIWLHHIHIPNSVVYIGSGAFEDCSSLETITIPDSVTSINAFAFDGCHSLKEVIIPNSVKRIGDAAFRDCRSLEAINIPNSVISIGDLAFSNCHSLKEIIVPDSVINIGEAIFLECSSLIKVSLPKTIDSIEIDWFMGCLNLQDLVISDSIKNVDKNAFSDCRKLKNCTLNSHYKIVDCMLINIDEGKLISGWGTNQMVNIPKGIAAIGDDAFGGCTSLEQINIPNTVTSIGKEAFSCCEYLEQITIPNAVTRIEDGVFWGCKRLRRIDIPNSITSIGCAAFNGCKNLKKIIIPKGSIDRFKKMLDKKLWDKLIEE